jgi:hypothetical protein
VDENHKYKLIGHNYVLPDLVAKVTGRAKYSEDFARVHVDLAVGADEEQPSATTSSGAPPATPSMIVASLDAGRRIDEGLVTHV